ncbi:vacuolar protein sorting-associated protein 16 homolog [Lissotriton helveticus]
MACYTANWNPLGSAYYRKLELYSMGWGLRDTDLRESLVAAAPYGGPIALLRPEKAAGGRPTLDIYSASGQRLGGGPWKSGRVVQLGWTASEELLCVQEDGTVLVHDLCGRYRRHFSMGSEVKQNQLLQARLFHSERGTGLAILTGACRFTLTTSVDELRLRRMPDTPLRAAPACWEVIYRDRQLVLLFAAGPDLYLLDSTSCTAVTPPGLSPQAGGVLAMSVSFTHKYLALFTDTGRVWMGVSSMKEKLCERSAGQRAPPTHMTWCLKPRSQHHALVLLWDRSLVVLDTTDDSVSFVLDEDSHLVPELDGVRIISASTHEFFHEIPKASEEIFKIASMAPGALLLEAQKEYEKECQKADEYLREIKEQELLAEAVEQCIEAAGYEYEPDAQKSLLRAASFGKCFIDKFPPHGFVKMCHDLRILNAVRDYQIGIPLSYLQYKQLTVEILLDRLVLRRLYPLALKICEYLRLSEFQGVSRILAHWACYKVQQKEKSDEEVAQAINQKLGDTPGISYSEIASKAFDCGRSELAIKLLEYEPRSGEQVPLLLKMKRSKLALNKAIESGDTDLVYTVVSYLKNELNRGEFFMTLQNQPVALSLYRQLCKHQEVETLKDLYNQDDDHQELGNFHIRSSYSTEKGIEERVRALQNAVDEFNKAKNDFAAKATEDQIKLLRIQRRLQEELDKSYLDFSLHETVTQLILDGMHKKAEQLYKDFKIPDKMFWWLKISALADREDWEEMEKFAKSKKSPIGYLPFVEVCVKHHNRFEGKKYISRVNPEQRVKAFLLVGDLDQAAESAIEHKNETEMNLVLSKCTPSTDHNILDKINRAKTQILKK